MSSIYLYNFTKRLNSTKHPNILTDTNLTLNGNFKSPCSVLTPIITIEVPSGYDLFSNSYNYAYFNDTGRFYYIEDIVMVSGRLAELHLREDVLASYKSTIGNSSQFVTRASAAKNEYIVDNMYPITNNVTTSNELVSLDWDMLNPGSISDGFYVIGIVNPNVNAIGAVSYYVMDQIGFARLRNYLLSTTTYSDMAFTEIEEPLYKSLFNPFQYIVSCVWFPIKPPTIAIGSGKIDFGFFQVNADSNHQWYLNKSTQSFTGGALMTVNHPQLSDYGAFIQCEPYTRRKLLVQPFGEITLDCSKIRGSNHDLRIHSWIDFTTGDASIRIINMDSTSISEYEAVVGGASAKLGVPLAMAQVSQDVLGMLSGGALATLGAAQVGIAAGQVGLSSVVGGIGMTQAASNLVSGATTMVNGITSAANAYAPKVSGSGTNGSLLNTVVPAIYEVQFYRIPSPDHLHLGAPLCDTRTISTLSGNGGFIKCENARIITDLGAYAPEIEAVESYMNNGFYYE